MKIALLGFPLDSNYGSSVQRYALVKVLSDMGHEPVHLYTRYTWPVPGRRPLKVLLGRMLKKIKGEPTVDVFYEYNRWKEYNKEVTVASSFHSRNIRHTVRIEAAGALKLFRHFDAYIVGPGQVWRRSQVTRFPYSSMFLSFVKNLKGVKRIAYGVSFGTGENELPDSDLNAVTPLYRLFDAVSVREKSALSMLERYGWTEPGAEVVLDSLFLPGRQAYEDLINKGVTHHVEGDMFCYMVDPDDEKAQYVIANEGKYKPFFVSPSQENRSSVEQWLRSFRDADIVVTDSYCGLVFSLIFNKPFKLFLNEKRGNERFASLLNLLGITRDGQQDWDAVNARIEELRARSLAFLKNALEK